MSARPPKPELPKVQLDYKQSLTQRYVKETNLSITAMEKALCKVKNACVHFNVPIGDWEWSEWQNTWTMDCGVKCVICGESTGAWYCPDSPNHLCEYEPEDRACDFCIHCGLPDERK